MGYANGRIPKSALSPIPGGNLRRDAAAAWNAMNRAVGGGLRPRGSRSSYRTYAEQLYFWGLYRSGRGNLAARPGTSNHGWGVAVDLAAPWMRQTINHIGGRYGWRKTEAFNEWWHLNYVGGFKAAPRPDRFKWLTAKEKRMAQRLLYHRAEYRREARTGKGRRYRRHYEWAAFWRKKCEARIRELDRLGSNVHHRQDRLRTLRRIV